MTDPSLSTAEIDDLIVRALHEDLQNRGDVTSRFLLQEGDTGAATIVAKEAGVIAGISTARRVFQEIDSTIEFQADVEDGQRIESSDNIIRLRGSIISILTGERTALNFLQRLSGIATVTARFVAETEGTATQILDTRKTTPGLRELEKHAVRMGGGQNHRMGLYDMILIKENHISAAGGITPAVNRAREKLSRESLDLQIEVEVTNLSQLREAAELNINRIMLDNMSLAEMKEAVRLVGQLVELEVSGGVTLDKVRSIAETGVHYISVGALTHSARALDLSLLLA